MKKHFSFVLMMVFLTVCMCQNGVSVLALQEAAPFGDEIAALRTQWPDTNPWLAHCPKPLTNGEGTLGTIGTAEELPADMKFLTPNNFWLASGSYSTAEGGAWIPKTLAAQSLRGTGTVVKTVITIESEGDYQLASTISKAPTEIAPAGTTDFAGLAVNQRKRAMTVQIDNKFITADGSLEPSSVANPEKLYFSFGYNLVFGSGTGYRKEDGIRYATGMTAVKNFWDWSPVVHLTAGIHEISITLLDDSMLNALCLVKVGNQEEPNNFRNFDWTKYLPDCSGYNVKADAAAMGYLAAKADIQRPVLASGALTISKIEEHSAYFAFPASEDSDLAGYRIHFVNQANGTIKEEYAVQIPVTIDGLSSGTQYSVTVNAMDHFGNLSEEGVTGTFTTAGTTQRDHYFISPDSFDLFGSWYLETMGTALEDSADPSGFTLCSPNKTVANTAPAVASVDISHAGEYKVWIRSNRHETFSNDRYFNVAIGEDKDGNPAVIQDGGTARKFAYHSHAIGWEWEDAGTFQLREGENKIYLLHTAPHSARVDAILITKDQDLAPPVTYSELSALAKPKNVYDEMPGKAFPQWANGSGTDLKSNTIENQKTKVTFYQVQTEQGMVVQNEIQVKNSSGNWVTTHKRDENLGWLVLKSQASPAPTYAVQQDSIRFKMSYPLNGETRAYLGTDPFSSGTPCWMIPYDYRYDAEENSVTLLFNEDAIDFSVKWSFAQNQSAKKINTTYHGYANGLWRLPISLSEFEKEIPDDSLAGARIVGTVTTAEGKTVKVENEVQGNERSGNHIIIKVVPGGEAVSENIDFSNSKGYSYDLALITDESLEKGRETIPFTVGYQGYGAGMWRLVVPQKNFQTVPAVDEFNGAKVVGTVTTASGKVVAVDNYISGNEISGNNVILKIIPGGEATSDNIPFGEPHGCTAWDLSLVIDKSYVEAAPKVEINVAFNEAGAYTIGMFEGKTFANYEYAMQPFRIMSKRVPAERSLITEQFASTPLAAVTLGADHSYSSQKLTKGIAVDPSSIPLRWVYSNNGTFGMGMRGLDQNVGGSVFAPLPGTADTLFDEGDTFYFAYRVINDLGDWNEAYQHVAEGLFEIKDYRQNQAYTLNDAIFNTRKLMLDDTYSGWDAHGMGYYNMEGRNVTSEANPMEALQVYLLTENKEYLEKRTIPAIANLLTRGMRHFNRTDTFGGTSDFSNPNSGTISTSIGSPIDSYNLDVYSGLYEMARGQIPYLLSYGLEKKYSATYSSVPSFSDKLAKYKVSGSLSDLDIAIKDVKTYISNTVYGETSAPINWTSFTYINYYPNLAYLIEAYETTAAAAEKCSASWEAAEQAKAAGYEADAQAILNAARYAANILTTTIWVPGVAGGDKYLPVTVNDYSTARSYLHYGAVTNASFWWHGDVQLRPGGMGDANAPSGMDAEIQDQNSFAAAAAGKPTAVASWVASRAGLGLEQPSTFGKSANMIMSCWAGDLLKLAQYTGEEFYATIARNAIIGRFATYPGYYQNHYITIQQYPEYPYEGPDYTGIYWHHISPFLAMLEDFIINMVFYWSDGNIQFPSLRQVGYAYFNSNQYGFAPGKFFTEEDMWLWLDEDVLDTGNRQIDWVGAKKDGTLGFALMNESDKEITTTVTLGDKIPDAATFSGTAYLYDKSNPKIPINQTQITNGQFTLKIPAKSLKAVIIKEVPGITAPAFSSVAYDKSNELGETAINNNGRNDADGKGYILQMSPDEYYAYVYIKDKPEEVRSLTINYRINGAETKQQTTNSYPFEFLIPVSDPNSAFSYSLIKTLASGASSEIPGGTLVPANADLSVTGISIEEEPVFTSSGTTIRGLRNGTDSAVDLLITIAAFRDGRLIDYKSVIESDFMPGAVKDIPLTFDNPAEGATYKYFIWDWNTLKPALESGF